MKEIAERLEVVENAVKMAGLAKKEVLTFEETAQYTGFSKSYLYKLTMNRRIPHYKPGGKLVYFNRAEIEAWLQQNRASTQEEISGKAAAYVLHHSK